MTPAMKQAIRLMNGYRIYQMVVAACRLNLPDLLAAGPKSLEELAAATGTKTLSLHRYLKGMVAWGVFGQDADGRYSRTEISDVFRADRPGLRNLSLMLSGEAATWSELVHVLRTGEPAFDKVHGMSRWEKLAQEPEEAARFNAAMVETTSRVARDFVAVYDCAAARTVVDVGGGSGQLLATVLQANPQAEGILFDLRAGLEGAAEKMRQAGLHGRVTIVEGSFFESVPVGADLYLLKSIIHDWDDAHDRLILDNCRRAMRAGSRLVLLERYVPDDYDDSEEVLGTFMSDLNMMVMLGGRERTPREYEELFGGSGLRMTRTVRLGETFAAYEAVLPEAD